jgi:hypothetical protein
VNDNRNDNRDRNGNRDGDGDRNRDGDGDGDGFIRTFDLGCAKNATNGAMVARISTSTDPVLPLRDGIIQA